MTRAKLPKVLVYGPFQPPDVACGISSAARAFALSRVKDGYAIELKSTFRTDRKRSLLERLAYGTWLGAKTACQALASGAALVDIHTASDRSLLSHSAVLFGARLAGRPVLLRIHGGDFLGAYRRAGRAHKWLIRLILRSATRVVVLSEGWRGHIRDMEPGAVVEVVPNSVDCRAFGRLADRPHRQPSAILFLANFTPSKGHFDALEALGKIAPRFPNVLLMLAGEDRERGTRAALEKKAVALGISQKIRYLGVISGSAKDQALREADMLILPSHIENMPISVMEGMAAALPVVATSVGAVAEMIHDGKTGYVVRARDPDALANRIEHLLSDAHLGRRLGLNAQSHALATWDIDIVAERNIQLYTALSGHGPEAPPSPVQRPL